VTRRLAAPIVALTLLLGAAACSSSGGSAADPGSSQSSGGGGAAATQPDTGNAVPTSGITPRCVQKLQPHFLISNVVHITDKGFSPKLLVAGMGWTVTWHNDTSKPQSVYFDSWGGEHPYSGTIAPGKTWKWKADRTGTVLYHSTYDPSACAQVQVQLTGAGNEP
jgi:plastocyanin